MARFSQTRFLNHAHKIWPYCQWCNKEISRAEASTDHIIPYCLSKDNSWTNRVISCKQCNNEKDSKIYARNPYGPIWNNIKGHKSMTYECNSKEHT